MKVFSRDKYIKKMGRDWYDRDRGWIDECHMKTPEECKPFGVLKNWLAECREVQRRAKKGEYVRIKEYNFDKTFSPGDIVKCIDDNSTCCQFENEDGKQSSVDRTRYVVREIVEEEEKMENVKQLLKNGDMVITRNGEKYIFMKDYLGRDVFKDKDGKFCYLASYDENLRSTICDFTVIEIKQPKRQRTGWFNEAEYETKWKREEVKEMTVAEIEKELGYKVKVVKG